MKPTSLRFLQLLVFATLASFATPAVSAAPPPPDAPDQASAYPLDTCVVSGEKLGSMGKAFDHVHKAEGQPDRLVRLCCKGCLRDFNRDPARYLKVLDEAAGRPKA